MIDAELRARQAHQPGGDMTPTDDLDNLFLTVTCPTCSVGPGERCTIRRGPLARTTHLARQDRAVRADKRRDTAA